MNTVENNKFIFSDERKYRIIRHLLFWGFWGFYFDMTRVLNPIIYKQTGHFPNLIKTTAETFIIFLPQIVLVYPLLYFILPRYVFSGKYIKALICIIVFLLLSLLINAVLLISIPWPKVIYLSSYVKLFEGYSTLQKIFMAYLGAFQGSLVAAGACPELS
jgi:hypothetical protein